MNRISSKVARLAAVTVTDATAVVAHARNRSDARTVQSRQGELTLRRVVMDSASHMGGSAFFIAGSRAALIMALVCRSAGSAGSRGRRACGAVEPGRHGRAGLRPGEPNAVQGARRRCVSQWRWGSHWAPVELPPASAPRTITAIAVSAGGNGALYVAGPGIGVLRSDDGGRNWSARKEGLPGTDVAAFATHADRPEYHLCLRERNGIYRSEDGGQHWRLMDAGPRGGITRFVHSNMPGSMQSGWLFVAGRKACDARWTVFCGLARRR